MTWPLAAHMRHHLFSWGDPVFQAWTMAWDVHALRTDPRHIFDANIFYPYRNTLAYSDHLFGQTALVLPVLLATGNAILADNLSVLLALALSGLAMYLLVVDLTGSRLAGLVAGATYSFAPTRLSHLEHLHLLSAQWLPLGVLTARRALQGNSARWAAALGLVVLVQGLFGIYFFYFLIVLLAVVVGTYLLWHPTRATLVATAKVAVACAVAVALLLPTLLPYQRVHDDLGIVRTEREVMMWRAKGWDYLAVSPSNRLYGDQLGRAHHRDIERDLFPGVVLLGLAIVGLLHRRLGWVRWMLFALTALSVLMTLGLYAQIGEHRIPLPYRLAYDYIPGFRAIRVPARLALLGLVGLSTLAGIGVDLLLARFRELPRWTSVALSGLVAGVFLAGVLAEDAVAIKLPRALPTTLAETKRPDYAWMAAHPAPTIEFPMGEGLIVTAWPNFWSVFHWNPVVNGYSGFAPPVYYPFRDRMHAFPSPDTIRLLQGIGVRTVVYHADPKVAPSADPVLQRIRRFPELSQVVPGPDYVFQLRPDPWLWRLAAAVPPGAAVDLPAAEADRPTFGMLAAILQRTGHVVYGHGTIEYWTLPPAPPSTCYAVLPAGQPPARLGYAGASVVATEGGLTLVRAATCSAP